MIAALIMAAGRGMRARKCDPTPKQYAKLAGEAMLSRTLRTFLKHEMIDLVQVVIHPDDTELYASLPPDIQNSTCSPVFGGATRQESVLAGLKALQLANPTIIVIHDAARPLVEPHTISAVIAALDKAEGAIAAHPVYDTLKKSQRQSCTVESTVDRSNLWRAQTPQAFMFSKILSAHRNARKLTKTDFTDDSSVAEFHGMRVSLVENSQTNFKITTAEDLVLAEEYLQPTTSQIRVGQGYDVHKFASGDHVWLCGVRIPHNQSLKGHSDADVAMHALTDAIYGALSEGDIGYHFPPSDDKWRSASSDIFLQHAAEQLAKHNGHILNVDITIVCEAPKIDPYRNEMCIRLASILQIERKKVSVKATTTETLGFTGRREGIAALALATIYQS
ncbi:MAG: Bifunctional enzyme IspD/IspF [Hyphomicrobiaceae bacterium hypho_1]